MATLIFDFDDTLFDTKRMRTEISDHLILGGLIKEDIEDTYEETKQILGNYNMHFHIKLLKERFPFFDVDVFYDWFNQIDIPSYVFPDAIELLKSLRAHHHLVLLTKGEFDFQNIKVQSSNLLPYFNEFHIVPDRKEVFLQGRDFVLPVYFVNDKETENEAVKNLLGHIRVFDNFRKLEI